MTKWMAGVALAGAVAITGCYTVLRAPSLSSSAGDDSQQARWDDRQDSMAPRIGRFRDDEPGAGRYGDPWGSGSFPIMGYDSRSGLYGFGMPFAYGYGSPYGGYGPTSGPYGYGYDPYYSGGGTYVPPGYELVTTQELDQLRADLAALQSGTLNQDPTPAVDPSAALLKQQQDAQRAWEQRKDPERKSTGAYRTPRQEPSSGTVTSSGSSKPAPASGSDAAKRRQSRR